MTKASVFFALSVVLPIVEVADAQSPPVTAAQSQTASVTSGASAKGKVVGPSNEPQAGVPIQVKGPLGETVVITDKSGTWSLYNLPAGNYRAQMIAAPKSNAPEAIDFTVKNASFFDRLSGGQKEVVWTPDMKIDGAATTGAR